MSELTLPDDHPYIGGRTCTDCLEFKPAGMYSLERGKRAYKGIAMRSYCKPCNEFRKYKSFIKRAYGINYDQYEEILKDQGGVCAICKSEGTQNKRATRGLFVDHCHTSGKVRGLLCSKCNHAIGLLNDNPRLLHSAIDYLTSGKN